VTLPRVLPVTVIEHAPAAERAQVAGEGSFTLPVPDCDHVIVSPVTVPAKAVKVAVHVDVAPTAKFVAVHDTERDGVALFMARVNGLDTLPEWSVSPLYVAVIATDPLPTEGV
jgi:hypothetical protein